MEESGYVLGCHEGLRILARLIARRITKAPSIHFGDLEEEGLLPKGGQEGNDECQLLDENYSE